MTLCCVQARDLYAISEFRHSLVHSGLIDSFTFIDKVRLLYDRSQQTARIVVRSKAELESPLVSAYSYIH
jgi:hypothetical protein